MKKGLKTTLLAAASIAGISSSYAAAPVITGLPDIRVGDQEQVVGSDSNIFIFTGAFRFDDHVTDADTTVSELLWSFDELDLDGTTPSDPENAIQWYTVNDKDPVHQGSLAAAGAEADHVNPPSINELRQPANGGGEYADFRDIVYSGRSGNGPFTVPSGDPHSVGRALEFFVSDTTTVSSQIIYVKTVDNTFDEASGVVTGPTPYEEHSDNTFTASTGWVKTGSDVANAVVAAHDATAGVLNVTVFNADDGRYQGWIELNSADDLGDSQHLKYSQVGADKFVRAKFSVYATSTTGGATTKPQVPNFQVRLMDRFGYCNNLFLGHNLVSTDDAKLIADDITPSVTAGAPSVYRVDIDPPELPYYSTVAGANEGLQRFFQSFVDKGETWQVGRLNLAESSIGVYGALDLSDNSKLIKEYKTTADFAAGRVQWSLRKLARGAALVNGDTHRAVMTGIVSTTPVNSDGGKAAIDFNQLNVTMNPGGVAGVELKTSGVPDSEIGIAALDWLTGAAEDDNNALRARIEANKQYAIRFYASATGASSNNAMIRFRARSVKFAYTHRLEVGGAWNQVNAGSGQTRNQQDQIDRPSHVVGREYLPGTGGYAGSTAAPGAPYDVLMVSPMMPDTRADVAGDIATKFPQLSAQPGPGDGSATLSRRDIFPAADIMDSLSGDYYVTGAQDQGEKGYVKIHKIEIRAYDVVAD